MAGARLAPRMVLRIMGREKGALGLEEGADHCAWFLSSSSPAAHSHLYRATRAERASCRAGRKVKTVNEN